MLETIYTSEKVMPYVYYGVHKITGQFYFGSRTLKKQKNPSHVDFGTYYFTSSGYIKEMGFDNFDWIILAEFLDGKDALSFEDECIDKFWKHPLSLNFQKSGKNWNTLGIATNKGKKYSKDQCLNISKSLKGKPKSEEHKQNVSKNNGSRKIEVRLKLSKAHIGKILSEEHKKNISKGGMGKIRSEEAKRKSSESQKGRPNKNKGIPQGARPKVECPYCNLIGGHNAMIRYHFENCKKRPTK
jgi:hypothetical protein